MRNLLVLVALLAVVAFATHQPRCGDTLVQDYYDQDIKKWVYETCDDGNLRDNDGCSHTCQVEECGDGIVQYNPMAHPSPLLEECDDGNKNDNDGCSSNCKFELCGDGIMQAGEECDDGNKEDMDNCSPQCKKEVCGDGIVQYNEMASPALLEQCDDGNNYDGDGCSRDCVIEYCGDGIVQPELGEICDAGVYNTEPTNIFFPLAWCSPSCHCVGFDAFISGDYATKLGTCVGADDYYVDISSIEPGYFCPLPRDIGVLGRGITKLANVNVYAGGPPSPFYGGWDIDMSGVFSTEYEDEYGIFYKFTSPSDSGMVHITTFLEQNHDPSQPYFIEVYEQPCAEPTDYIVSHGTGAYWGGDRTGYADAFFWAKPNTAYYFFTGVRLSYYGSAYGSWDFYGSFEFDVRVEAAPYTDIDISVPYNVALTHQATYYVTEEHRNLMPGQWFKLVVPNFDESPVGTELCMMFDTHTTEVDYNYVQIFPGGSSVYANSGEYPLNYYEGYNYYLPFTATVGSEWWVLVQCDNSASQSCVFSFVVYLAGQLGYPCSAF